MDIKFVDRDEMHASRKRGSKYRKLLDALEKLEVDEGAIEVEYEDEKSLNSMRTAVYQYNYKNGVKIKSGKDTENKKIYFYREK
ncbi:MAG: hypothetical protein JXR26_10595 [Balneolaceae bacterium]|nr:hypothetical protein [Balneolaceae bacterium]